MQREANIGRAASSRRRKGRRQGWIAFAAGMIAMFGLLAFWIGLVEMGGERKPKAVLVASELPAACQDAAISDCR
ncbi:hypothetical protein SH203_00085 [Brevundimonas sp. SH203]|uniref:hypothetical protein n=1 Tax=Brevundimonas sp. SH203 TaxID=345167 RepID=UPI0009CE3E22|nr:hypothetical protein [Brevundimonas sp. SH203]GAW39709.1 hypothetical protein SH203_00085 [Brevundimonas sp. SH203]